MGTILDSISTSPSTRPKYTQFELASLVRNKRNELGLTVTDAASKYHVTEKYWKSIEDASRVFNVKEFKFVGNFLEMTDDELLSREVDDLKSISFRATDEIDQEMIEAIERANSLFGEMIMQAKISSL